MDKLKNIKLLLLDVDGVLTDGGIIYDDRGVETKVFNVKDGLGIRLLLNEGIQVGIVTGRRSQVLYRRCEDLGIDLVFDGIRDKAAAFDTILERTGLSPGETAFMGDDLPDLPIMKRAGVSIAVSDAHEACIEFADLVTNLKGGTGAVREVCEMILKAKGLFKGMMERFKS